MCNIGTGIGPTQHINSAGIDGINADEQPFPVVTVEN